MLEVNVNAQASQNAASPPLGLPPRERTPANPNGATGPITAGGKAISSMNAVKHGLSSTLFDIVNGELTPQALSRLVLPDETVTAWHDLLQKWIQHYNPDTVLVLAMVTRVAVADWILSRSQRRFNEAEHNLLAENEDVTQWTVDQHAKLERFLRYQTKAERTFYRSWTAVEQWRRERKRDAEKEEARRDTAVRPVTRRAIPESPAAVADPPTTDAEPITPPGQPTAVIQCITVQVLDGRTVTIFQPRSESLARILRTMDHPKPIVKRALYFLDAIPDEYSWIRTGDLHESDPHIVFERTAEQALDDFERERLNGSGHVLEFR